MSGQFLLDAVEGVVLVEAVEPLEPDVAVPLVLDGAPVPAVLVVVVAAVAAVAALATSAPPAISPLVSAPTATTLRIRSFMVDAPSG
jgi:hypothetical protein